MKSFLYENNEFITFSLEHYLGVIIFIIIGIFFIYIGKNKLEGKKKSNFIIGILFFVFLFQIGKIFVMEYTGVFDIKTDLPLHLCNMLPVLLLTAYFLKSRLAWSILFLWIMAGTFQSLFTPTLHQSFPHYEWWRYWIVHTWLVTGAFYGIIVFNYRLEFKDLFKSLIWLNVLAFIIFFINRYLGSNYMFMQGKPDGTTMYSLLSKWPYYIIELQVLALILFSIIYLPFYLLQKRKLNESI